MYSNQRELLFIIANFKIQNFLNLNQITDAPLQKTKNGGLSDLHYSTQLEDNKTQGALCSSCLKYRCCNVFLKPNGSKQKEWLWKNGEKKPTVFKLWKLHNQKIKVLEKSGRNGPRTVPLCLVNLQESTSEESRDFFDIIMVL